MRTAGRNVDGRCRRYSVVGVFTIYPLPAVSRRAAVRSGLRPLPGLLGDIRDASMRPLTHLFDRRMLPRINAIRAELGVPRVRSVDEFFGGRRCCWRSGVSRSSIRIPDWGDAVHLIGACVFEPTPATAPEWLAAIDRPIVLVSTSSIRQADSILGRTALEALADEPVHVVPTFPAGAASRSAAAGQCDRVSIRPARRGP